MGHFPVPVSSAGINGGTWVRTPYPQLKDRQKTHFRGWQRSYPYLRASHSSLLNDQPKKTVLEILGQVIISEPQPLEP